MERNDRRKNYDEAREGFRLLPLIVSIGVGLLVLAALLFSGGCTAPPVDYGSSYGAEPPTSADQARCAYEAQAATANIRNGLMMGLKKIELERACMRAASARRTEEAKQP